MTSLLAVAAAAVVTVVVAAGYARARLVVVTVTGESMQPLIARGARVLVRRTRRFRRGDIVLLRSYGVGPPMLKQAVAVAGDPVPAEFRDALAVGVVPDGTLLVRGTTADSLDSRQLGPLPATSVIGVAVRRR
ncbi:S26 family signal peptidase [Actinomycetes bacterium KLBMP 9797]